MEGILLLAIPVACISWTIAKEELFDWLRHICGELKKKEYVGWQKWLCEKIAYWPTCYFCLSHFIAFGFLIFYPVKILSDDWRGYVIAFFAIVLVANFYLTLFNILRASLRFIQAKADVAELDKKKRNSL